MSARQLILLQGEDETDAPVLRADEFAAHHLGVGLHELFVAGERVGRFTRLLVGHTLKLAIDESPSVAIGPAIKRQPASWELLELNDQSVLIPTGASVAFPAGSLAKVPVVARLLGDWRQRLEILTTLTDAQEAHEALSRLVERSRRETNPYRGQVVQASADRNGLCLRIVDPPEASRDRLIMPDEVWRTVERNVHRVLERAPDLIAAGLAANRGLLLCGPPGTGKTALSRVIASELAGRATIVLCDLTAARQEIGDLYENLRHLAPAVVIIEDIDLVAGRRGAGSDESLQEVLTALDGVSTTDACIITIGSTNDPAMLDEAARRAARFDVTIELGPPGAEVRRRILENYLAPIDHGVDCAEVARRTPGATGAELRELVRRAVIEGDGPPTTADLTELARAIQRQDRPGLYL